MYEMKPCHRNAPMVYDPFRELETLQRRFFGKPIDQFAGRLPGFRTDIRDNGDSFSLDADLPGCDKSDITLELNGDTLTVRAERKRESEEKDENGSYLRRERYYGSYRREFDVSAVDTDNIKAKYENGVLHLTLPKKQSALPAVKTLEIE